MDLNHTIVLYLGWFNDLVSLSYYNCHCESAIITP